MYALRMKKILITGASGMLGRKLAEKLTDLFDVLEILDHLWKEYVPD